MNNQIHLVLNAEQISALLTALRYTRKQLEILAEEKNVPLDLCIIETLSDLILYTETAKSVSKLNNK